MNFPWASLLRGVLGHDDAVLLGLAKLLAPGAEGRLLFSVMPRDGVPAIPAPHRLSAIYARHGLRVVESRPATIDELSASGSSWAKRLRAGRDRPVTLLRLCKEELSARVDLGARAPRCASPGLP